MSEQRRQALVTDLLEYFESDPCEILARRARARFTDAEALKLSEHYRNVVGEIVDELSVVFQEPPEIEFTADAHARVWNELWDALNIPSELQTIECYTTLCGTLVTRVVEDPLEESGLRVDYITPDALVVEPTPGAPKRAAALRVRSLAERGEAASPDRAGVPGARVPDLAADREAGRDTAVRLRRPGSMFGDSPQRRERLELGALEVVTDVFRWVEPGRVEWSVEDMRGTVRGGPVELPYDPFVTWRHRQPVSSFFAPPPLDLLSAQNRIVDHLVELGHQFRLNAFSIPVVSGWVEAEGGKLTIDPSRPLQRAIADDGTETDPLTYASPENDFTLQQLREAIKDESDAIRRRYGLTSYDKATSGFMVQVLSVPLMRRVRKVRAVMAPSLRRMVAVLMRARKIEVRPEDYRVKLVDSTLPEDPAMSLQRAQTIEAETRMGLTSRRRELKRRYPDLDDGELDELAAAIDAENRRAEGPDPLERALGRTGAAFLAARGRQAGPPEPGEDPAEDPAGGAE